MRRILIEGQPGAGKTTVGRHFAANRQLWGKQFNVVLHIPLRDWLQQERSEETLSLSQSLARFMKTHCLDFTGEGVTDVAVLESLFKEPDQVLLVLDGYDEVAHLLQDPRQPAYRLLAGALSFPQVIVTTRSSQRPPTSIRWMESTQALTFDRHLTLSGFSDEQVVDYVNAYFQALKPTTSTIPTETKKLPHFAEKKEALPERLAIVDVTDTTIADLSETFLAQLKMNPRIWELAHNPMNLALICDIWMEGMTQPEPMTPLIHHRNFLPLIICINVYAETTAIKRWKKVSPGLKPININYVMP